MNTTLKTGLTLMVVALTACTTGSSTSSSSPAGDGPGGAGAGAQGGAVDARFFLPTGEPNNTSAPVVEVDRDGNTHALYPAYVGGGAYYAFCARGCAGTDAVKVVRLETQGTVGNAMLALDANGRPRVLLSAYSTVYWGECDVDCTQRGSWKLAAIDRHDSDREVTGEALALDANGRPRYLSHTYRAYLGIGQKEPATWYVSCDAACDEPASWKSARISNQMWQGSTLRFDAKGRAHVATVAVGAGADNQDLAAYVRCDGDCGNEASWVGTGLTPAYESNTDAVPIKPTVSLAVTRAGEPRVLVLAAQNAKRALVYFECEGDCRAAGAKWEGTVVSDHEKLGVGADLVLDGQDRPRYVYTLDYNIILGRCDGPGCAGPEAPWSLTKVEMGADMPPDQIFLYPNCTVGAWFLHSPSIALTADGQVRVGYQARDVSGGLSRPDKTKPACVAGTDMTWSRLALLSKVN